MCFATGDEEFKETEGQYLIRRRALVFSGEVPSVPSSSKHQCRNDEEYGEMEREMRVSLDGGYTELWCPVCMRYLRMMIPIEVSRSRHI